MAGRLQVSGGPAPTWALSLSDADLRNALGADALRRGQAYARDGSVTAVTVAGGDLVARVNGSGRKRYTAVVTGGVGRRPAGRCSCPMSSDCKHVAAVLLAVREPVAAAPAPAAWESRLAALVEPEPAPGEWLGLQLQVAATGRDTAPRLRLRPVRLGSTGRWVRAGASWRDIEYAYSPGIHAGRQRDALRALHATWRLGRPAWQSSYSDAFVPLEEIGPSVWRLLAEAVDAGVALVDEQGGARVRLLEAPVAVEVDLAAQGPDGDLLVSANVALPERPAGAGRAVLVGRPASGLFVDGAQELLLAAFDRPLDPAVAGLLGGPPLQVPAADLPRFYRRFYPGLQRRAAVGSRDGSATVPELAPPRLALAVRVEPGHVTGLEWSYSYTVLDQTVRVPLVGGTSEVVRDPAAERRLLGALAELPGIAGLWVEDAAGRRLPVPQLTLTGLDTARFTVDLLPRLQQHPDVDVEVAAEVLAGGAPVYAEAAAPPLVQVAASDGDGSTDWFDLAVSVTLGGQDVPLAPLIAALAAGQEHLLLDGGTWFALDAPELQALSRLVTEARGMTDAEGRGLRLSAYQAGVWEELVASGVVTRAGERWTRTVGGLLDLAELPEAELPLKLDAELRPYQLQGYRWLCLLWDLGLGGILADDMGLGKTVQTLAMASRAYENGELTAPLLVVAPTSVVATWAEQAARFCPDLPVVAVTETARRSGVPVPVSAAGAALVVTSYALLRLDAEAYLELPWSGLVLDEAQHVKNPAAKTYSVVRRLQAPFALAITGTPLENGLMDLWALLSITAPGLFPDPQAFAEHYRKPIESGQAPERLAALRRRTRPLMLRRTKEQVAADLPPKIEQVVEVTLSPQHRRVYDRHLQRERQRVLGLLDDLQRHRFAVLKALTTLRQLSLDPALVDPSHAALGSAKIDVLVERLREVADEGHRALVFSSFTGFLRQVRDRLDAEGIGYCYLDGRTRDRPRRIAEFTGGTDPAFLISLKAGGTGLTLTEADYVFVLDPWWNPAAEAQAVDRAHRIGQTRTVMVYRLVAADTIEEKVVALQQRKRELFTAVVDGEGAASAALTADDIRALLA